MDAQGEVHQPYQKNRRRHSACGDRDVAVPNIE